MPNTPPSPEPVGPQEPKPPEAPEQVATEEKSRDSLEKEPPRLEDQERIERFAER
jgi:hypothetical protein